MASVSGEASNSEGTELVSLKTWHEQQQLTQERTSLGHFPYKVTSGVAGVLGLLQQRLRIHMAANCWQHFRCSLSPHLPGLSLWGLKPGLYPPFPPHPGALQLGTSFYIAVSPGFTLPNTHTCPSNMAALPPASLLPTPGLILHECFYINHLILLISDFSSTRSICFQIFSL